jgi:hypothetical protein
MDGQDEYPGTSHHWTLGTHTYKEGGGRGGRERGMAGVKGRGDKGGKVKGKGRKRRGEIEEREEERGGRKVREEGQVRKEEGMRPHPHTLDKKGS